MSAAGPERPVPALAVPRAVDPLGALEESFDWYRQHAREARTRYQFSELALLVAAACVPVSTVVTSARWVPATLGALVVVLSGLRRIFMWQENWIRFTEACTRLETERQLFVNGIEPYDEPDAGARLVRAVRRVETDETRGWTALRASDRATAKDPRG